MRSLFFGTENDILHGIDPIESSQSYCYVRCGTLTTPDIHLFRSLKDGWMDLNHHRHAGDSIQDSWLMIIRKTALIKPRRIQHNQKSVYIVDQLSSPQGILFSPGGLTSEGYLVLGWFLTHSAHPNSIELFRYWSRTLQKGFTRIGRYWFGPEAFQLAKAGIKLVPVNGYGDPGENELDANPDWTGKLPGENG